MTRSKITGDGWQYLVRHTARGDTDPPARGQDAASYYAAPGNPPGRWTGRGAHPNAEAMIRDYIDRHVTAGMTGRQRDKLADAAIRHATLGQRFPEYAQLEDRRRAAVAGFDLVFSPVKSAALLWAVDDRPHVRQAIRDAHEQAMAEALEMLEKDAAYTRAGKGGVAQLATNGLIAAALEHWDSRAGDPNLHTHVAVSAKVQGTDGQWRALDTQPRQDNRVSSLVGLGDCHR